MDKWIKMAESFSHKFGQIIGDLLEMAIETHLREFADKHSLYLDRKGERLTRTGKKLTWTDSKNNKHDLDYVLERDGTDSKLGTPVAFIETAWRRYTKHSRNKAQEIQGAIIPLIEKYYHVSPFTGVVLAGEFTQGSLEQLKSQGFSVLYFSYASVLQAFEKFGVDASFDEETPEDEFMNKLGQLKKLGDLSDIARELMAINKNQVADFFKSLEQSVVRFIENIIIWVMHGKMERPSTIAEAVDFISQYSEKPEAFSFCRYEIIIEYNTGTIVQAKCINKNEAIDFLERNAPSKI